MPQNIKASVFRVLKSDGSVAGAGFVIEDELAVTCAHVVEFAGSGPSQPIQVEFILNKQRLTAKVLTDGWSGSEADDIAFIQLELMPNGVQPVVLGSADGRAGHDYLAFGFPLFPPFKARSAQGKIEVTIPIEGKNDLLQLQGDEIAKGMSGAPVLDLVSDRVVGMITEYKDHQRRRFAYTTTAETLQSLNHELRLWPDIYGPIELDKYLDHLIESNQYLSLPVGGENVPLEQIYVSLRADQMTELERQAEYDLLLEEIELIHNKLDDDKSDPYVNHQAIRRSISLNPRMFKLISRDWEKLFEAQNRGSLSLTQVVRLHPQVVLLGDPGSGKTTLCRWLTLQFARGLKNHQNHMTVQSNLVQAGQESAENIDLGISRLPIFIRIAFYARARWNDQHEDTGLTLEQFISTGNFNEKKLPEGLTNQIIGWIAQDYLKKEQAFIILDGLDEVSNPSQRQAVMKEIEAFLNRNQGGFKFPMSFPMEITQGNPVLLTSRIVGYQFQPLTLLPHFTVENMDKPAILAFCRAWMSKFTPQNAEKSDYQEVEQQAEQLVDAIFDHSHPGVREMAGNPLLLTILSHVYWQSEDHSLPARRVTLFAEAVRAFYKQRESYWNRVGITPMRLNRALGAVAVYIHQNEVTGFAERGQVEACLFNVLHDSDQVQAILVAAEQVSGFLVSKGEGIYGFIHRGLQEYFAAIDITSDPIKVCDRIADLALKPAWREPISLSVGLVSMSKFPTTDRDLLSKVFQTLLDTIDPASPFLPRNIFSVGAKSTYKTN